MSLCKAPRQVCQCVLPMLLAVAAAGFAAAAVLCGEDMAWQARFKARMAALREQGQPVTFAEALARRPRIPDDQNSALVFLRAFGLMAAADATGSADLVEDLSNATALGVRHSEIGHDLIGRWLDMNAEALSLIREGAKLPSGVYPIQAAENPFNIPLPHLAALRKAARLLAMEARHHAESGDQAAATGSLLTGRRLAASIGDRPFLIDGLVRAAAEGLTLDAVERTLGLCEMPAEGLARLRDEMGREQDELSFAPAFITERAAVLYLISERPDLLRETVRQAGFVIPPAGLGPDALAMNGLHYCDVMDEAIRISGLPPRQKLAEGRKWSDDAGPGPGANQPDQWLSAFLMPAFSKVFEQEVKARTRLHVAQVALALEQWRIAHPPGREWPATLEQLVPAYLDAVPEDRFSDRPLGYVRTGAGVVVYSVGPDGRDDGGRPRDELPANAEGPDLAFRLLRPDLRGALRLTPSEEAFFGGGDLLHVAAQLGDKEAVERLLAEGTDVNALDAERLTPTARAARAGHADVAEFLRAHGGTE